MRQLTRGGNWEGRREERKRGEYGRVFFYLEMSSQIGADGETRQKKTKGTKTSINTKYKDRDRGEKMTRTTTTIDVT